MLDSGKHGRAAETIVEGHPLSANEHLTDPCPTMPIENSCLCQENEARPGKSWLVKGLGAKLDRLFPITSIHECLSSSVLFLVSSDDAVIHHEDSSAIKFESARTVVGLLVWIRSDEVGKQHGTSA